MEYSRFISLLPQLQTIELPGLSAQLLAVPPERAALMEALDLNALNPKKAAVTILLYPKKEQMQLVLIQRNTYAGVHSAQIAFPGGKIEPTDAHAAAAAFRETEEEIGVAAKQLTLVRSFTELRAFSIVAMIILWCIRFWPIRLKTCRFSLTQPRWLRS